MHKFSPVSTLFHPTASVLPASSATGDHHLGSEVDDVRELAELEYLLKKVSIVQVTFHGVNPSLLWQKAEKTAGRAGRKDISSFEPLSWRQ